MQMPRCDETIAAIVSWPYEYEYLPVLERAQHQPCFLGNGQACVLHQLAGRHARAL
jgi:hypothetical protein